MIPADETTLKKMFHWSEVPAEVEQEYDRRLSMLHRSGSNGPLGAIGLIDMTRFLGCVPPETAKAVSKTDWRTVPVDGRAQVTALWRGVWSAGVYVGPAPSGGLAVRLANDAFVREFQKKDVTLAEVTAEPEPMDDEPEYEPEPEVSLEPDEDFDEEPMGEAPKAPETVLIEVEGEVVEARVIEPDTGEGALVLVDGEDEMRRVPSGVLVA